MSRQRPLTNPDRRAGLLLVLLVVAGLIAACSHGGTKPSEGAAAARLAPMRLFGYGPEWSLEVGTNMRFESGALRLEGPLPTVQDGEQRRELRGQLGGQALWVRLQPGPCVDASHGHTHAWRVQLRLGGQEYLGCGGQPPTLLLGRAWTVQELHGNALGDDRVTLLFGADGSLSGQGPCNRFSSQWYMSADGLGIGRPSSTRMACAPELMALERRLLAFLHDVREFHIEDTGELVLMDRESRTLIARR